MRYRVLAGWVVGLSLTAALASVDCGGDDTSGTGTAGSSGKGGSTATGTTGGSGGASTSTSTSTSTGSGGSGGTTGSGGKGGTGGAGGSTGGGGTAGTGGASGATDGGTDAPRTDADGGPPDVSAGDASDAARMVAFSEVVTILQDKCIKCHKANDGAVTGLVDFATTAGLYARLTTPLPNGQEGTCGFGDGGTDDGGDGGDASPPNRVLVAPTDTDGSFLYIKITGRQVPGNPPGGCGQRMPRIPLIGADGGPAGSIGCDQADGGSASNCLSQTQIDTIGNWISQGANEFPPD